VTFPRSHAPGLLLLAANLLWPVLGGCNPNGYATLWAANDIALKCEGETSTWLRTYYEPGMPIGTPEEQEAALRTEFMILRSDSDPMASTFSFVEGGCMDLAVVERDGSIYLLDGTLIADGLGGGAWQIPQRYDFPHQTGVSILQRTGSYTTILDEPEVHAVNMSVAAGELTLAVDGEDRHYQNLMTVLASIPDDTTEGATLFAQVVNVGLLVSQVRVRGFGGAGMTEYINQAKSFRGLVTGDFRISGDISPGRVNMVLEYQDFADFTGMWIHGPQIADISWSGDGNLAGATDFVFQLDPFDSLNVIEGSFDYEGCTVVDGFGNGGAGTLTLNGMDFTVLTDDALVTDLRSVLPLD